MSWSPRDIPDQSGRTFVITGANSGIGFHAAKHLVRKGADVVLACRRMDAAEAAVAKLKGPGTATAMHLDLADLDSVASFAKKAPRSINVLINNAGIMMPPLRHTKQGYEAQWGTNVVGHAALTKALLPRIQDRVVTISSIAHRSGRIDAATFHGDDYDPWRMYAQSKLGNLAFALRLQKHLESKGSQVRSMAAHPGVSMTRLAKDMNWALKAAMVFYIPFLQSGDKGSWPTLRAATDDVPGGTYWGPRSLNEKRGRPEEAKMEPQALDEATQELVWSHVW